MEKTNGTIHSTETADEDIRIWSNQNVNPQSSLPFMGMPPLYPFANLHQTQAFAAAADIRNAQFMQQYSRANAVEVLVNAMNPSRFIPHSTVPHSLLFHSAGGLSSATHGQPSSYLDKMDILSCMASQRRINPELYLLQQHRLQPETVQDSPQPNLASFLSRSEQTEEGNIKAFPSVFHRALKELELLPGGTDVAEFLPDGRSFCIKDQEKFAELVLPVFFPRMKGFPSFQRQLNLYDFLRQGSVGHNRGSYRHHLFHRDYPDLSVAMKRRKVKKLSRNSQRT